MSRKFVDAIVVALIFNNVAMKKNRTPHHLRKEEEINF
jgi:hypothetical protein